MAEAVTVLDLLGTAIKVIGFCYDYIQTAKSAPKEIQQTLDDVASLQGLLERLKLIANDPDDGRFVLLKSLAREGGPFETCSRSLGEIKEKLRLLNHASDTRRRLQWPLTSKTITKSLDALSAQKTSFYMTLAGDAAFETKSIGEKVTEVRSAVEESRAREQHTRLLDWLSAPDPAPKHHEASSKREAGTCEWLTLSDRFSEWMSEPRQIMWVHSFPGAGKTILAASSIDLLRSKAHDMGSVVFCYYFDFTDAAKQSSSGLFKSLLSQICHHERTVPDTLTALYDECEGGAPSNKQLTQVLRGLLANYQEAYIVIDALDECQENEEKQDRTAVLQALGQIKAMQSSNVHVFITSRPEADIAATMKGLCDVDVDVQASQTEEDIRRHIRSCLSTDNRLKRWPRNIKDEIESKLMKDAGGMFRWVVCQLAQLRKCLKPAALRSELQTLPKTLYATYSRILDSVPELYQAEMRTILMLLALATRPLKIQEVAEAAVVNLETSSFTPDERFPDAYDILEFCSSLVTLTDPRINQPRLFGTRGPNDVKDLTSKGKVQILQFAHFSVKEYLLSERTQGFIPAALRMTEPQSQIHLTLICLIYLLDSSQGNRMTQNSTQDLPFLLYAACNWTLHLKRVGRDGRASIEALLFRLFDPQEPTALLNYLNIYNPAGFGVGSRRFLSPYSGPVYRNIQDFEPPLYYAAHFGLSQVVSFILDSNKNNPAKQEVLNAALEGAVEAGEPEMVRLLLEEGADPKAHQSKHLLVAAAASGSIEVVTMLISAGACTAGKDHFYGTALQAACHEGHGEIARFLIKYGMDLQSQHGQIGPPLSEAVAKDHHELVASLIAEGANVNEPLEGPFNPISLACRHARLDVARLLLAKGAVESLQRPGNRSLVEASHRGDIQLMQLLLDHGANINSCAPEHLYETPLKGAIASNKFEVLEFVLEQGADLDFKGSSAGFPVDFAIDHGNLAAADHLLRLEARFGPEALAAALISVVREYLVKKTA